MNTSAKSPQGSWRGRMIQIAVIGGMALAGALLGSLAAQLIGSQPERDTPPLMLLLGIGLALIITLPVTIALHELGHILGGRIAGFRFLLLIVGPLKIQRIGDRLHLGLNRSVMLSGGLAASTPTDNHNLVRRMMLMVAGGPMASLLSAAIALVCLPFTSGLVGAGVALFATTNLAIGIITLIPMRSGGFHTDGGRILMLWKGGEAAERWCAAAAISHLALTRRPREMDATLLAHAIASADNSLDGISVRLIAYSTALDQGNLSEAEAHLAFALANSDNYPAPLRPIITIEAAYLAARLNRPSEARAYLEQSRGGSLIEPYTRARAEAAVLRAEGNISAAQAAAQTGLRDLDRRQPGPVAAMEQEILQDLARAAE